MDLKECIKIMQNEVTNKFAMSYIEALNEVIELDGMNGLVAQMKYIRENIKHWRGDNAREVKTFLDEWIDKKEKDFKDSK